MRKIYHRQKHKSTEKINLDYVDVREVLDELGIDYRESGKNIGKNWVGVCCSFCGDDLGYHLGVCLESPVISCFRCGKVGNLITLTAKELHSYDKAITFLKQFIPTELKNKNEYTKVNFITKLELPKEAQRTPTKYQKYYIQKRGYSWKKLHEKYNFHYCGPIGDFANRIIVPIYQRRKLLTYTSIDIGPNSNLRYKHLPDDKSITSIKHLLFGIENTNNHIVCVVEGLFDQFRIGDGCVSSFGTITTPEQILLLSKFSKVVIAFDGDDPGKKAAQKLSNALAPFTEVVIVHLPNGYDPDSLPKKDIKQIQTLIGK